MQCDECGFAYEELPVEAISLTLRTSAAELLDALSDPAVESTVRTRPEPLVWSALEYGCHVRDVFLAQRDRVVRALVEDNPDFPPIHREERVELAGYRTESLPEVAWGVVLAADLLARLFQGLSSDQLSRSCVYWYPVAAERDVAWLGRHTVHEAVHHLRDVHQVLDAVRSGAHSEG